MESAVKPAVLIMSTLRTINYIEWGNVMLQEQGNCKAAEGKAFSDRKRVISGELMQ